MKLLVFGATGGIGSQVIAQALAAGHTVTAVARNPAAIATQHARLTVVQGDALDPATLAQPMAGQDAVISALAPARPPQSTRRASRISCVRCRPPMCAACCASPRLALSQGRCSSAGW